MLKINKSHLNLKLGVDHTVTYGKTYRGRIQ
jgi:hypothetical protein